MKWTWSKWNIDSMQSHDRRCAVRSIIQKMHCRVPFFLGYRFVFQAYHNVSLLQKQLMNLSERNEYACLIVLLNQIHHIHFSSML